MSDLHLTLTEAAESGLDLLTRQTSLGRNGAVNLLLTDLARQRQMLNLQLAISQARYLLSAGRVNEAIAKLEVAEEQYTK